MIKPTIVNESGFGDSCSFTFPLPQGYVLDKDDFTMNTIEKIAWDVNSAIELYGIAVLHIGGWEIERGYFIAPTAGYLSIYCTERKHRTAIAFPIDPRMTRADIEGAKKIYPNADDTGWLFAHARPEDHHDRSLVVQAIVSAAFEKAVGDRLNEMFVLIVNDRSSSQQRGKLIEYDAIKSFREACIHWVREYEKALHVGEHIQEEGHHYHLVALKSITETKRHWVAEKADDWSHVGGLVDKIISVMQSGNAHSHETRWDKAKRLAEEAKKAASAETQTETTPDDSSNGD